MSYALKFEPDYPEYCNIYDRMFCHTLVSEILSEGYSVTIWDGEENCIVKSRNFAKILEAMSQTGEDIVIPFDSCGERVGWFSLIYANGSEGDPMICMSDMSSNPISEAIYDRVEHIIEEREI